MLSLKRATICSPRGGDLSKIMTPTKRGFAPPLRKEAPASHAPKKKVPEGQLPLVTQPATFDSKQFGVSIRVCLAKMQINLFE